MKLTKDSSHLVEFIEKKTQKNIKINKNSNNYLLNLLQQLNYHYHNSKKFIDNNIVNYNLVENLPLTIDRLVQLRFFFYHLLILFCWKFLSTFFFLFDLLNHFFQRHL